MRRRLYTLDVFTTKPYSGNPLAVVTDGDGLSQARMQDIAREMNLSETVFVQKPTSDRALARLRIFTTTRELPLAGHPVIGTWFLLATLGVVPASSEGSVHMMQQTGAGILPVELSVSRRAAGARYHDAKARALCTREAEPRKTRRRARPEAERFRRTLAAGIRFHRNLQPNGADQAACEPGTHSHEHAARWLN